MGDLPERGANGRMKMPEEDYRQSPVGIRFRSDERALIERAARIERQTLSEFVRRVSLDAASRIHVRVYTLTDTRNQAG